MTIAQTPDRQHTLCDYDPSTNPFPNPYCDNSVHENCLVKAKSNPAIYRSGGSQTHDIYNRSGIDHFAPYSLETTRVVSGSGPSGTSYKNETQQCAKTKSDYNSSEKEACCAGEHITASGKLNSTLCRSDWFPFSKSCDTSKANINYCGSIDKASPSYNPDSVVEKGLPYLVTDRNCSSWCVANPKPCDQLKLSFCATHPSHDICACINPQGTGELDGFLKELRRSRLPVPNGPSYCWWNKCAGVSGSSMLKTTSIVEGEKTCPTNNIKICQQIIEVQKTAENNVISGNTFRTQCNTELPPPKGPVVPSPVEPKENSDNSLSNEPSYLSTHKMELGIGFTLTILIIVMIIVLRL